MHTHTHIHRHVGTEISTVYWRNHHTNYSVQNPYYRGLIQCDTSIYTKSKPITAWTTVKHWGDRYTAEHRLLSQTEFHFVIKCINSEGDVCRATRPDIPFPSDRENVLNGQYPDLYSFIFFKQHHHQ
jgi:hypothetical protein